METKETTAGVFQDHFFKAFSDEGVFFEFMKERHENATWKSIPSNLMKFIKLKEGTFETQSYRNEFAKLGKKDLFEDTLEQSALLERIENELFPIRKCALDGVLERLGISGNGLKRLSSSELETVLNLLADRATGETRLYESDGKITGVHSGNPYAYSVIPAFHFFERIMDYLFYTFSSYSFSCGEFRHSIIMATWNIEEIDEDLSSFKLQYGELPKPVLRAVTSDTGASSAALYPGIQFEKGPFIPMGSPIKTLHRGSNTLRDIEKGLDRVFVKVKKGVGLLGNLLEIELSNPIGAMSQAMKEAKLPIKKSSKALDQYYAKLLLGNTGQTAFHVYQAICEILSYEPEKTSPFVKLSMEENILRLLYADWEHFERMAKGVE